MRQNTIEVYVDLESESKFLLVIIFSILDGFPALLVV